MLRPDQTLVDSLVALEREPHFERFASWMQAALEAETQSLLVCAEADMSAQRGRCCALRDVYRVIRGAREALRKIRQERGDQNGTI